MKTITGSIIGSTIRRFDRLASTNVYLEEQIASGAFSEGEVVIAREQTGGRGRLGRSWYCPPGEGLLMSVALCPEIAPGEFSLVTAVGALAVRDTLENDYGVSCRVRWPNDVVVNEKKICGVLGKAVLGDEIVAVLGIGVNLNFGAVELPAELAGSLTSLNREVNAPVDDSAFLKQLIDRLNFWYDKLRARETDYITEAWKNASGIIGRKIALKYEDRVYFGVVDDLSASAGISLLLDDGTKRNFPEEGSTLRI